MLKECSVPSLEFPPYPQLLTPGPGIGPAEAASAAAGGAAPTLPPPSLVPPPPLPLAPVRQGQPGDPDAGSHRAARRPAVQQHPPMAGRLTCCLLLWALGHGGCRSLAGEGAGSQPACPVQPPAARESSSPGRDPRGGSPPPPALGSIAQDMVTVHMLKLYEKYNREGSRPGDGNTVRSFKAKPGKTDRARGSPPEPPRSSLSLKCRVCAEVVSDCGGCHGGLLTVWKRCLRPAGGFPAPYPSPRGPATRYIPS